MNNQFGFIQILISLIIIAALFMTVVYYLNNTTLQTTSGDQLLDDSSYEGVSPKGIIDNVQDKIDNIESNKEKEIQDYLNTQ